jgi:hypothetical protein
MFETVTNNLSFSQCTKTNKSSEVKKIAFLSENVVKSGETLHTELSCDPSYIIQSYVNYLF